MYEIRIHGRGGQGGVLAASVLAEALFAEGKCVQAFPNFGVERRGAPVAAFVRFDSEWIELRCQIYNPDFIILLDPTLIGNASIVQGLKPGGNVLINSDQSPDRFADLGDFNIATVDASSIALEHKLGSQGSPIVNTAILGAFAKFSELLELESVKSAVGQKIPYNREQNMAAVVDSYENVILPTLNVGCSE